MSSNEMNKIIFMVSVWLLMAGCVTHDVANQVAGKLPVLDVGLHREAISVPDVGTVKYAIRVDDSYNSSTPAPLVLVLHHGYEGPNPEAYTGAAMMEKFMGGVREIGGIAIAPDALGGDWSSSNNEHSVVWLVNSAINTYNIDANQIYVIGYSMGGAGTLHIAGRHQDLFTGAIPAGAPVTGTTKWTIPVYVIHSTQDELVPYSAAKSHAAAIEAAGGTIQFKTVNDLTHFEVSSYDTYVVEGVKWLRTQ
jgi:predicted peptidase